MTHTEQSSDLFSDVIGINFAADVIKQNRRLILVIRETVPAYTCTAAQTLRDNLRLFAWIYTHSMDQEQLYVMILPLGSSRYVRMLS